MSKVEQPAFQIRSMTLFEGSSAIAGGCREPKIAIGNSRVGPHGRAPHREHDGTTCLNLVMPSDSAALDHAVAALSEASAARDAARAELYRLIQRRDSCHAASMQDDPSAVAAPAAQRWRAYRQDRFVNRLAQVELGGIWATLVEAVAEPATRARFGPAWRLPAAIRAAHAAIVARPDLSPMAARERLREALRLDIDDLRRQFGARQRRYLMERRDLSDARPPPAPQMAAMPTAAHAERAAQARLNLASARYKLARRRLKQTRRALAAALKADRAARAGRPPAPMSLRLPPPCPAQAAAPNASGP